MVGSIYSRLFALGYDSFLAWGERAGMQALRRDALAEAAGSVLEIGAGTGLNASLYPADVERITFSEPDQAMRHRLSQRLASLGRRHEILDAPADHLPVDSGAVDTVVSTLVLCTVADLAATLAEIRRVLAPGGRLILIEHVRAADAAPARLARPFARAVDGLRRGLSLQPRHPRRAARCRIRHRPAADGAVEADATHRVSARCRLSHSTVSGDVYVELNLGSQV